MNGSKFLMLSFLSVMTSNEPSDHTMEDNVDITVCSLCNKLLDEPRLLPCLDAVCLPCLGNVEKSGTWNFNAPYCPRCGEKFALPDVGLKALPSCGFLEKVVRKKRIQNLELTDRGCEVCAQTQIGLTSVTEAVGYCLSCEQKLCQHCCDYHKVILKVKVRFFAILCLMQMSVIARILSVCVCS